MEAKKHGGYRGEGEGFGRPPKAEKQDKKIMVNCYQWQKEAIEAKAKQAGLSTSAYLVMKGLED